MGIVERELHGGIGTGMDPEVRERMHGAEHVIC